MSKPGAKYEYSMPSQVYSRKKIEGQINHYCKSEGINLSHYLYLMEAHEEQITNKSKAFKLPLGILSMVSIFLVVIYTIL